MQLECYKIYNTAPEIVPGRSNRDWMDAFPDRQPYRCLPLSMANSTGWEILCPMDIKIVWNGGPRKEDIFLFTERFDGYVFVDEKGNEYPAMVELAPYQKVRSFL